jgi:hypothetical protein
VDTQQSSTSPGGDRKAVVFVENCGATSDFATGVAVVPVRSRIGDLTQAVFTADSNHGMAPTEDGAIRTRVIWLDDTHLRVSYDRRARIFRQVLEDDGVLIEYVPLADGQTVPSPRD